jgi:hypothetical protein
MVAGKLFVRPMYPGTGSVRVLLVGRLMRRERSAARTTAKTIKMAAREKIKATVGFFTNRNIESLSPSSIYLARCIASAPSIVLTVSAPT